MGFALSSPAFTPGGEIPALFTCEGRDLSPALDWTGVPEAALRVLCHEAGYRLDYRDGVITITSP